MIIVDRELERREEEGRPVRVGMVGAGAMGRGIALQLLGPVRGIELTAISNRSLQAAENAYRLAGAEKVRHVSSATELDRAASRHEPAVTEDPAVLCESEAIEVILEVTGTVEFGAGVVLAAIEQGKHVVTMNAELQGTLGPLLKTRADQAGVVFTDSDGDQPGVIMNLYRFVEGIGVRPVLAGNLKGLHDPYRNPTTQEAFARQRGLTANMATSFADGTKISFEMAIVANATGLRVAKRGMHGPAASSVHEALEVFAADELIEQPIVDYLVGAKPAPGVFVLGHHDHPSQKAYLDLYKLGPGPLYVFYRPYHLCHFEVPSTLARAALFRDATIAPLDRPRVEVVTAAKRDLNAGELLDGIGFYMTYGLAENAETAAKEDLLPMGVAEGCRLKRDLPKDYVLTYADVELPQGRLCDELRAEQAAVFAQPSAPAVKP